MNKNLNTRKRLKQLGWKSILLTSVCLLLTSVCFAQEEKTKPLLSNEFSIFYQNSFQFLNHNQTIANGWHENQIRASGQISIGPQWIFRTSIMGDRSDLELKGFATNPIFSSDSFSGELSLNYLWHQDIDVEIAGGLSYFYYNYNPNNLDSSSKPITYTGSILDFEHTRQGPGFYGVGHWKITDKLSLLANTALYPYLFTQVKKGDNLAYIGMTRLNAQLRYALLDGFLLSTFINQEIWVGSLLFSNTSVGIGLTLVPSQIPEE